MKSYTFKILLLNLFLSFQVFAASSEKESTSKTSTCDHCKEVKSIKHCSACKVASYCGKECQRAAWQAGHKIQCREIKAMQLYGLGQEADGKGDFSAAFNFYRQASELGSPKAKHDLAFCYLEGEGVDADEQKSLSLLQASANLGYTKAMTALAIIYNRKADKITSYYWQHKATLEKEGADEEECEVIAQAQKTLYLMMRDSLGAAGLLAATTSSIITETLQIGTIYLDHDMEKAYVTKDTEFVCRVNDYGQVVSKQ